MRRFLLATALTAISAPSAFAWTCPTGSTVCSASDSGSAAASQSLSSARSLSRITVSPTINVAAPTATASPSLVAAPATATAPASGSTAANPSAKHHWSSGGHSNGSNVLVQQFPPASAFAAPLSGGPCNSSGVSGGAQTAWFGLSFAHQRFDYGCAGERMGDLMTVGQKLDWAYQCQDDATFRKASASIGMPCPVDKQREASVPVAYEPAMSKPAPEALLHGTAGGLGYCTVLNGAAERRRHPECE